MKPNITNLGVSRGPSKSERATINKGNASVETHYGSDTAETVDPIETARQARAESARKAQNEIDADVSEGRRSGRIKHELTTVPGINATGAHEKAMAQHSADFIHGAVTKNRAKMEAARSGYHAARSALGRAAKGVESPCGNSGCNQTTKNNALTCGEGGCSTGVNVQRPKG